MMAVATCGFSVSLILFTSAIIATRQQRLHVAFSGSKSQAVIEHGPYRYIRHPFYASYILFWASAAATGQHVAGWAAAAAMMWVYALIAASEEREMLDGPIGVSYAAYISRTGRFLPRLTAL
jgi:protein-S-isoprenylcysteine O-methyltransferase Ste14